MQTKTINLLDATVNQLNWLAAKCNGFLEPINGEKKPRVVLLEYGDALMPHWNPLPQVYYESKYLPSSRWEDVGPIQFENKLSVHPIFSSDEGEMWEAHSSDMRYDDQGDYIYGSDSRQYGPTPHIAIVRCFVTMELGKVVEIPVGLD